HISLFIGAWVFMLAFYCIHQSTLAPVPMAHAQTAIQFPARVQTQGGLTDMSSPTTAPVETIVRRVHDPVIIKHNKLFYLFATGPGVPIWRSPDLKHWSRIGRVFKEDVPEWAQQEIVGSRGLWAPDIAFWNGRYHLYYSVSTFGKNRSLIGLATNPTLDPDAPDYRWSDEGKVVESFPRSDYNAIDANFVEIAPDRIAMSFGSFWSGLKFVALESHTAKPASDARLLSIAQRPDSPAIEAPYIVRHGDYFYLFVSFDKCCAGVQSTYNVRVGRSRQAGGPYFDREGRSLLEGGGTMLLESQPEKKLFGPGHCSVLRDGPRDYLVHHFYDGSAEGVPTLQVRPLSWSAEGWPVVGKPL
ncbi:MAG: arabinan endo,5-alpha-L-arabinosidase, partial [Abditibacteriota bacterium]|nr:arabinan endo,5-alpha-L-arabinosidase [Abditibacteriota bacterium]